MTNKENVNTAEKRIVSTNTAPKNIAPRYVKVKRIVPAGKQDVYNLEVAVHHNFSVNGGVIVHNCMDSFRYYVNTIITNEFDYINWSKTRE